MARLTHGTAADILARCKVAHRPNFFTLGAQTVDVLLEEAREYGYRKPKNANGSKGRYWYEYLLRITARRTEA